MVEFIQNGDSGTQPSLTPSLSAALGLTAVRIRSPCLARLLSRRRPRLSGVAPGQARALVVRAWARLLAPWSRTALGAATATTRAPAVAQIASLVPQPVTEASLGGA